MQLAGLCSLCEVGIGINLAFGALQELRARRMDQITAHLTSVTDAVKTSLSEVGLTEDSSALSEAAEIEKRFKKSVHGSERWFVRAALGAALLLMGTLTIAAIWSAHDCALWLLVPIWLLSLTPVVSWRQFLERAFTRAQADLDALRGKNQSEIAAFTKLAKLKVEATRPNGSSGGAQPSAPPPEDPRG